MLTALHLAAHRQHEPAERAEQSEAGAAGIAIEMPQPAMTNGAIICV